MKIGILTFHGACNYGAVLQAYALQKYLSLQGHDVGIIDYNNDAIMSCYKVFDVKRVRNKKNILFFKAFAKEILCLSNRHNRKSKFENFASQYFNLIECTENSLRSLDLIVVGSDQVWNILLTNGFDSWYWGEIAKSYDIRIISYAASMEQYWGIENDDKAKSLLHNFNSISVRENSLKERLMMLTGRKIDVTVDPTLLIEEKQWNEIAVKPSIEGPYIFLYQVRNSQQAFDYANRLAKKNGMRLVCVSARVSALNTKGFGAISPAEFIGLIKYASIVIACSFHGVVFSVLFQKKFIALKLGDGRDSRYVDFLNSIGLASTLKDLHEPGEVSTPPEYSDVSRDLKIIVNESKKWLEESVI